MEDWFFQNAKLECRRWKQNKSWVKKISQTFKKVQEKVHKKNKIKFWKAYFGGLNYCFYLNSNKLLLFSVGHRGSMRGWGQLCLIWILGTKVIVMFALYPHLPMVLIQLQHRWQAWKLNLLMSTNLVRWTLGLWKEKWVSFIFSNIEFQVNYL